MNNQPPYIYETDVEWTGAKAGELRGAGLSSIEIAPPPEFGGMEGVWTPEHLFVAAVNSCFMTTFLAIAELSKLEFVSFDCRSEGLLEKLESSSYQISEIILRPRLVIRNRKDTQRAFRILDKAERHCLVSKSIKSVVRIQPEVTFDRPVRAEEPEDELMTV